MKNCPYCGYSNREGEFFCIDCGRQLIDEGIDPKSTRQFANLQDQSASNVPVSWGTIAVDQASAIIIHIRDAAEPLEVKLADVIVLGRADDSSPRQPDIDLTPYGALEKGVSRLHAQIERGEDVLTLVDIGSSNGTFLNHHRLEKNQPRTLRDGDEIRLGKLVAHIYFK